MRTLAAAVLALAAVLLAGVAIPAAWADKYLLTEDGFVQLAGPLGNDRNFQDALTDSIVRKVSATENFPPGLAALVQPLLEDAARDVTHDPGYPQAWDRTLRRSHALTLANITAAAQGQAPASSVSVTLDIAPLIGLVSRKVSAVIGADLPEPAQTLITAGTLPQGQWLEQVPRAGLWPWAAGAAGLAAVLALLTGRRSSTTLAGLGLGTLALGALYWLGARPAADLLLASNGLADVAATFLRGLVQQATGSFARWSLLTLAAGVILLVTGLTARLVTGRR